MNNILGYENKNVVITGCATGMGRAAAELLVDLGANVYALDIGEVTVPVKLAIKTDMKNKTTIDAAIDQLPSEIYALFNCAGVPHPPFSAIDTIMINFVGLRHLTEALIPRISNGGGIASIASTAGMAWASNLDLVNQFLALKDFDAGAAWVQNIPEMNTDPYGFSKQCLIVYTMTNAKQLAAKGIRINTIAPSPTATAFMDNLTKEIPEEAIKMFCPSIGRFAEPEEMGQPLVLLNSKLASFISGLNIPVDFGYSAEVWMGQRDNLMNI
tara:strand:- start:383 stop:1192 length:810 start_codon:yes stop_codon:yes gene_type:complete